MKFSNLKIKNLTNVLKHTPDLKQWQAKGRHTHIMGIQLRGNMYHEMNNKSITLSENCLFFFNQKDDFQAFVKEPGESYSIHFTTWEPIETETFVVKTNNAGEAVSILQSIENALRLPQGGENLAISRFYRFCYLLESLCAQNYHPVDNRMSEAKAYIDLHFCETNVLNTAAKNAGISRRRFNDLFKLQFSLPPNRYLNELKISKAKAMLVDNGLTVKKIAELCGFEDHYYFCKVFKAYTQTTPTLFRKSR